MSFFLAAIEIIVPNTLVHVKHKEILQYLSDWKPLDIFLPYNET